MDEDAAIELIVKELKAAKEYSGIQTIVDATPINSGRDVKILKQVSEESGVNILAATGLFAFEIFRLSEVCGMFCETNYRRDCERS